MTNKSFADPVKYKTLNNGLIETEEEYTFWFNKIGYGKFYKVPKGTLSNKASIPLLLKPLWNLIPERIRNSWLKSFIMHDRMVGEHGQSILNIKYRHSNGQIEIIQRHITWKTAAIWLKQGIKCTDKRPWMRYPIFWAVQAWGKVKKLF